ncbi:MAG: methyltransferase domain-containing protein [Beijerinckiaceae bacterium]|nr:methyltransferase domain-containing protein [Beijerinckiaceae bacterium]
MTAFLQSSGDLIADRRFAHARDYAGDCDLTAAIDLFEQTLERAPHYAPAWFELGKARLALGLASAADAFREAARLEPADALGARLHLARLGALSHSETAMKPAYVEALFDQYAPRFESHLVETLHYDGPVLLRDMVEQACATLGRALRFSLLLDLGCGTGLGGAHFASLCGRIEGCDLSRRMVEQAARKGVYDALEAADALTFLLSRENEADLVLAADVLPYIDALEPLFEAAAAALLPGGLFAVSAQTGKALDFELGADLRFHHSASYIEGCARAAGLGVVCSRTKGVRRDRGIEAPGVLVVLRKP